MIISTILLFSTAIIDNNLNENTISKDCLVSGIVNNLDIKNESSEGRYSPCSYYLYITVNGKSGIYKLKSWINLKGCMGGTSVFYKGNIPKMGDKIEYLIMPVNDIYHITSVNMLGEGKFEIKNSNILEGPEIVNSGDFLNCEPTENYIETTKTMNYSNGYNLNISSTNSGKKVMFINGNPQLEMNTLLQTSNSLKEKLLSTKDGNNNLVLADNVASQLKTEKLIEVYSKFVKIDFNIIPKFKDLFSYLGNKIGVEIYNRVLNY